MWEMNLEAIHGFCSPTDPVAQARAFHYYQEMTISQNGWQICIEALTSDGYFEDHVKFFCFQVLEHYIKTRYDKAGDAEQKIIRDFISKWIHLQSCSAMADKNFIRNKAAHVVCLVFLVDYPHRWLTFFSDLLQTLTYGPKAVDFYLRVLLTINTDIADREIARAQRENDRNTNIKDAIRDQCVKDLADSWYHILTTYESCQPDLVCLCLQVIGAYIAWIDINLIANDRFVEVLVHFLSNPRLREASCDCIHEILNKGMEPISKTKLVESFVTILDQVGVLNPSEDEDGDFVLKLSKLVNGIGTSLTQAWTKLVKKNDSENAALVQRALKNKVPLLLRFLSNDDDDVSLGVTDFAREYIQFLKQQSSMGLYGVEEKESIKALLDVIVKKFKYDDSFNFQHQGEDEAMFDEFRKTLKVLYENITLLDPEAILTKSKELIVETLQHWRMLPFQDVEVALLLLYVLGEAIPSSHGNYLVSDNNKTATVFTEMLHVLMTSGVSAYGHMAVVLRYFEIVTRYEKFFAQEPMYIPDVLVSFMDERGLRNECPRVRSRVSFLFSRFIKSLKARVCNFTEDVLKRVQDLLVLAPHENMQSPPLLSPDDQLYLYEATAILIVSSQFEPQKKHLLLKNILTPVISKFEVLLMRLMVESDEIKRREIAECMNHAVAVTSRTSKAFSNQQTVKSCGCVEVYIKALEVFLQALEKVPYEQGVLQSGVRQFLHRMVVCLEEDVLPFIPVAAEQLLKEADMHSIQEFIPLINQVIVKFKKEIVPFLQRIFLPLVTAIFNALAAPIDETDQHAQRDRQLLQRSYFNFISAVVANTTQVLAAQDMQGMEQVMLTVIQGAVNFPDPVAQKTCFSILRKMVELWGNNSLPGFVEFMYKSIVPACFLAPMKDTFDLSDAQTILALSESVLCLRMILEKRGDEFIMFLQNQYLPSLNVPMQQIQEYCHILRTDPKCLKTYSKNFFQQLKS